MVRESYQAMSIVPRAGFARAGSGIYKLRMQQLDALLPWLAIAALGLLVAAQAVALVVLVGVFKHVTAITQTLSHIRRRGDDTHRHAVGIAQTLGWGDDFTETKVGLSLDELRRSR